MRRKKTLRSLGIITILAIVIFCCYRYYVYLEDYSIYEIIIDESRVKYDTISLVVLDNTISSNEFVLKSNDTMHQGIIADIILVNPSIHNFTPRYYDDLTPMDIQDTYASCKHKRMYVAVKNSNKEVINFLKSCSFDGTKAKKIK